MDKDAEKRYRDLTPEEKYKSAVEADKAPWNPVATAKELIIEKLSPKKQTPKPALKYGPSEEVKKFDENYKKGGCVKKTSGGKVSQLAKANGIAVRGRSKGRII